MGEEKIDQRGAERETLADIYARERSFVSKILRRFRIPDRDVPDVVQEVFIRVQRALERYDTSRPLRPWLFGIAYRVASDHCRLSRNLLEVLDVIPAGLPAPGAERLIEAFDEWRVIDHSLSRLGPGHRLVLLMHDFLGYDVPEIASALNIIDKTVYSRLHSARRRFQAFGVEALQGGLLAPAAAFVPASDPD
jgi:RNA polymerase sigma-70 factor (ECF subfamily)